MSIFFFLKKLLILNAECFGSLSCWNIVFLVFHVAVPQRIVFQTLVLIRNTQQALC